MLSFERDFAGMPSSIPCVALSETWVLIGGLDGGGGGGGGGILIGHSGTESISLPAAILAMNLNSPSGDAGGAAAVLRRVGARLRARARPHLAGLGQQVSHLPADYRAVRMRLCAAGQCCARPRTACQITVNAAAKVTLLNQDVSKLPAPLVRCACLCTSADALKSTISHGRAACRT